MRRLLKLPTQTLICGLLLLFWVRLQLTAVAQSVTFDEILHILHGTLIWQSWQLYGVVQNPPLVNMLIGLPVQLALPPIIPFHDPIWASGDWLKISQQFMWTSNSNGLQIIWVGRQAVMLLAVLLGALVYRFAAMLFRARAAGLLALVLYTFDPNILAHSFLATTDLGTAFFFLLAAFAVWHCWQRGGWWWYGITAVAVGLVLAAKFSGVIFIMALVAIAVYRSVLAIRNRGQRGEGDTGARFLFSSLSPLLEAAGWVVLGSLVFLALYRFQFAPLLDDWVTQQRHQATGHDAFLLGEVKRGGWWYYFPLIFLIKTPLPTLLLLVLSLGLFVWRRGWRDWAPVWLLLLAGGVLAAGLMSRVNIGYRYLLPMLPLLFVFVGGMWTGPVAKSPPGQTPLLRFAGPLRGGLRMTVYGLLTLLSMTSLALHPHYLAYFNVMAGGPANGWRWAVDSNVDWGQDIQALGVYMAEHHIDHFYAAWLGSAPLTVYGMGQGEPLPVWPVGKADPLSDAFYPDNPAPGVYVLSATQLQGAYARDPAFFAWFRDREPDGSVGYSLFVYDIPASGPVVGLALSGIGLPHLHPDDYGRAFASNNVQPRWFDSRTSFLWPGGQASEVWTAVGDAHLPTHPLLRPFYAAIEPVYTGQREVDGRVWGYYLYHWPEAPVRQALAAGGNVSTDLGWSPQAVVGADEWESARREVDTAVFGDTLQLLGYQMVNDTSGQSLSLLSFWQMQQPTDQDLKVFVHLLDGAGNVVAQHDGLDVRLNGLQPGDEWAQLHAIPLPKALPPGNYALQLGVYDAHTLIRLPLANLPTDRILLHSFSR